MSIAISSRPDSSTTRQTSKEAYCPPEPRDLPATGISDGLIDSLIVKFLLGVHSAPGRTVASVLGLPFSIISDRIADLKTRRMLISTNVSAIGDYTVQLTEEGHGLALRSLEVCRYVGTAPVPLEQYKAGIENQSLREEPLDAQSIQNGFKGISIPPVLMGRLGPAIRSASAILLYGAPGNGKTTIAEHIGRTSDAPLWIPRTITIDGTIVKLFDPAHHEPMEPSRGESLFLSDNFDNRWVRIRRPMVITGGELTLDHLEIQHNPSTGFSEAPLQLKANGGVLVIDDFGRQRVAPVDLLNRWIVPLDRRYDLLSLHTGKKFQVPFDQLVVFSTNLEPADLVDEAFLRRIPYKVHVSDPGRDEFREIFQSVAEKAGIEFRAAAVEYLLSRHYDAKRPMRRCHPRDLVRHLKNHCEFHQMPCELDAKHVDKIVEDYFLTAPKEPRADT